MDTSRKQDGMPARALVQVLALVALVGCGGGGAPKRPVTPLDHTTTGTVEGEVRVDGTPPASTQLTVGTFPGCSVAGGGTVSAGDVLVADGRVQNAVVWVKSGLGDRVFAVPDTPVEIDQKGCLYVPRVVAAQVGQPIVFKNSDATLHNVHGTPKASSGWNFGLAVVGASRTITIDHAEVPVGVRCDVHPWMQAWVAVTDHPYVAVTGADGRFALRDVPPGEYVVAVWHERLGTREARVALGPRETKSVAFTLGAQ